MSNPVSQDAPKISVLIPVYNGEQFLQQAIDSILNQSYKNFECLIINDGSTDASSKILQEFQARDPRVRLISHENRGLISVLNEGLTLAQGEYIARMDADDIAEPERLRLQVEFLDQHPSHVAVGSKVYLIDTDGNRICPFALLTSHDDIDTAHLHGRGGTICHPAVMFRKEAVQAIGGYSPHAKHAEDLDLFLRLGEVGQLANLPEALLQYRMHPQSIGHRKRKEQQQSARVAVMEAHQRRGLSMPETINTGGEHQDTLAALYQKWAWWALTSGNVATARKHARLAVRHAPISTDAWKTLLCTVRGY